MKDERKTIYGLCIEPEEKILVERAISIMKDICKRNQYDSTSKDIGYVHFACVIDSHKNVKSRYMKSGFERRISLVYRARHLYGSTIGMLKDSGFDLNNVCSYNGKVFEIGFTIPLEFVKVMKDVE